MIVHQARAFGDGHASLELARDAGGDLFLNGESIRRVPFNTIGPDLQAIRRVHKLEIDPEFGASGLRSSRDCVTNPEFRTDFGHIDWTPLRRERRLT